MSTVTFFETREELCALSGLPDSEALWNAGFDLDDWDFGVCSEVPWAEGEAYWERNDVPYYQYWLLQRMSEYCVGYQHFQYGGKHFYMAYHS